MAADPLMVRSILKYEGLFQEPQSKMLMKMEVITWEAPGAQLSQSLKRQPDFRDPQYARQDQGQVFYTDLIMCSSIFIQCIVYSRFPTEFTLNNLSQEHFSNRGLKYHNINQINLVT